MVEQIRIGALISGGGTNLQAIIDSCESKKIDGEMVFVGSDNPDAKGLKRAEKHNIPFFIVDYAEIIRKYKEDPQSLKLPKDYDVDTVRKKQHLFSQKDDIQKVVSFFNTRAIAESLLIDEMSAFPFDLLVLAGFMRNLTPYFIDKINTNSDTPRIMNIHPALLPAFPGVDGYGDTFRYGCKVGGCTVHFVDYGEDSGAIIGQRSFPILETDSIDTIKENGLKLEWELYPECVRLFSENRLRTEKKIYGLGKGKTFHRTIVRILPP